MDMVWVPQNHLGRLPEEILLMIMKQRSLSVRDLISLAQTNHRNYRVGISPAYKAHIEQNYGLAIYWAIENGQQATLERLVENGVSVDIVDRNGIPIFSDRLLRNMGGLELTKAHMAVVEFEWPTRVTPLAWAASEGQDSMVESLLDNGARLELPSEGLCKCSHGLLISHCSKPYPIPPYFHRATFDDDEEDRGGPYGWTALHYALCHQNASTAQLLLARGADATDLGGMVPALLVATQFGLNGTVEYLMANSLADINAKNPNGVTALHLAHLAGRYDLVARFLEWGADINARFTGEDGPWTVFSMACATGLFDRALQYLRRGADPRIVLKKHGHGDWDAYTAMRLIWGNEMNLKHFGWEELACAMELEQEIIARGNEDAPVA
ncbi:hypothetical protein DHEL01_v209432 [Diaporthe helianthi]|uniref:Uncharacterized protein n=1 Tax=Diaporthe helianthi TaxID=158607 RepID=A0A2P5HPM6_DIAHE|nr:hypothetical protein DHEL01_v209432 [Diaporthe helianthi]